MSEEALLEDYKSGKIVLIDKPLNWTSFDVVNKIRWKLKKKLKVKKIKVGHAGTLDPLATGLLIICIGKATKIIDTIQNAHKEYIANVKLGATTPSFDLETEIDATFKTDHIDKNIVIETLKKFEGEQMQMPPIFSAKKVDGKPAYEYARKNKEVELQAKKVVFHEIELQNMETQNATIRIKCSKGTYIRSFAHDLGKELNSGAHLTGLVRTAIGQFDLSDAWSLEDYIEKLDTM
ncbi:MAG: tRNA pseudouridine(55) synthase TruB [Salinivirgaceae bacterium]|nr:MAG: tRNA pseudouridine(55) synthase TruB [Salinivirgaceae bacterium]